MTKGLVAAVLVALFAVFLLIVGCASSSGSKTAASSASAVASRTPTASPTPTAADVFAAYLTEAKPVRARFGRIDGAVYRIGTKQVHSTADSTWAPAGRKIAKLAKRLYRIRTDWMLVTPPPGLAAAHRSYGKVMDLRRRYCELYAYCLLNKLDMSDYSVYGKQLNALMDKSNNAFENYRLAVSVRARQLHVKIPWKWIL